MSAERPFDEQLSAYLDGELSRDEREEVEARLREDALARRRLEELKDIVRQVSALPRETLAPEEAERIAASLRLASGPKTSVLHTWRRPMALAASVTLVFTLLYQTMVELQKERERLAFAPYADKEANAPADADDGDVAMTGVERFAAAPESPRPDVFTDSNDKHRAIDESPAAGAALRMRASQEKAASPAMAKTAAMPMTTFGTSASRPATTQPAVTQPTKESAREP
jgi:hypothetical protein